MLKIIISPQLHLGIEIYQMLDERLDYIVEYLLLYLIKQMYHTFLLLEKIGLRRVEAGRLSIYQQSEFLYSIINGIDHAFCDKA